MVLCGMGEVALVCELCDSRLKGSTKAKWKEEEEHSGGDNFELTSSLRGPSTRGLINELERWRQINASRSWKHMLLNK